MGSKPETKFTSLTPGMSILTINALLMHCAGPGAYGVADKKRSSGGWSLSGRRKNNYKSDSPGEDIALSVLCLPTFVKGPGSYSPMYNPKKKPGSAVMLQRVNDKVDSVGPGETFIISMTCR